MFAAIYIFLRENVYNTVKIDKAPLLCQNRGYNLKKQDPNGVYADRILIDLVYLHLSAPDPLGSG